MFDWHSLVALALCAATVSAVRSCEFTHNGGKDAVAPFAYYKYVDVGVREEVSFVADESTGLCVYPQASCRGVDESGRQIVDPKFQCCGLSHEMDERQDFATNVNSFANLGLLTIPILLYAIYLRRCSKEFKENQAREAALIAEREAERGTVSEDEVSQWVQLAKTLIFVAAMVLEIVLLIFVPKISQDLLSVQTRNAQLAADAYLTPVREIFQFLEDVVTVNINMAMGMGSMALLRSSLSTGISGGAALGALAAVVTTILVYWPASATALFAPFAAPEGGDECSQLLSAVQIVDLVRTYIILSAWQWPFLFINMSLRGFLLGASEWTLFGVIGVLEMGTQAIAVLGFFQNDPNLATLGWAKLIGSSVTCAITMGYIMRSQRIRDRYLPDGLFGSSGQDGGTQGHGMSWQLVQHGLSAMLSDLSVQMGITGGIYVVGLRYGVGAMYQVSAFQAAYPQFGLAYVVMLGMMFRVRGTQFLGMKAYDRFERFYNICLIYTCVLAVSSVASLWPGRRPIAFGLGKEACEFASEASCLHVFEGVFGGPDQDGMAGAPYVVFLVFMAAQCFYRTFKAGVYACMDWNFMAKSSIAAIIFSFLALLVAALVVDSSTAILVAMYAPCAVLAVAYSLRTARNIKAMKAGESGPWDQFIREQADGNNLPGSRDVNVSLQPQPGNVSSHEASARG